MKKFALYPFILVAFLCGSSLDTYACDCVFGGGVVCEDFWKAKAVFVGGKHVYSPGVAIKVAAGLKPITLVLPDK